MLITFLCWIASTLNQEKGFFFFFLYQPRWGTECQGLLAGNNWVLCDLEHDGSLNSNSLTQILFFFSCLDQRCHKRKRKKKISFVKKKRSKNIWQPGQTVKALPKQSQIKQTQQQSPPLWWKESVIVHVLSHRAADPAQIHRGPSASSQAKVQEQPCLEHKETQQRYREHSEDFCVLPLLCTAFVMWRWKDKSAASEEPAGEHSECVRALLLSPNHNQIERK